MTVKELLDIIPDEYYDYEFYRYTGNREDLHTDFIESVELDPSDYDRVVVKHHVIMDEEEYDNTILANSVERADFGQWYDDKNVKILVIIVEE